MKVSSVESGRNTTFRHYFYSQLFAETGSRIAREGLPIVAIMAIGARSPELAIMAALSTLPALLGGNFIGHWVDHTPKRRIMVGTSLFRAVVLLAIPALYFTHHLTFMMIALVTLLIGISGTVLEVGRHAFLPFLVGRHRLEWGNQRIAGAESVGETLGPGIMGVLIQGFGAPLAMAFDSLAHGISALWLSLVPEVENSGPMTSRVEPGRWASIVEAWQWVASHPTLRVLFFNAGLTGLFGGFFSTLYELYVLRTLGLSPLLLGVLITLGGIGSLAGSQLFGRLRLRISLGGLVAWSFLFYGFLTLLVPFAPHHHILAWGCLAMAQFGGDLFATIFEIGQKTVEQQITPDDWLGRVHGSFRALSGGLEVVGALLAGVLALWLSVRGALWISSLGILLSGAVLFMGPLTTHQSDERPQDRLL